MRTFAIVTTCNEQGYQLYGREMVSSVDRFFPHDVPLHLYAEGFLPDVEVQALVVHDLPVACPALIAFKDRHRYNPVAHGQVKRPRLQIIVQWHKPRAKIRRVDWGFGYRWDAVRFSHKVFAICHAARQCKADVLLWMDADIRVFSDVSHAFLEQMLPAHCIVSCLRRPKFSECSFMGFNLRHPAIAAFLQDFEDFYVKDMLFKQREFHDSYLFDVLRKKFEKQGNEFYDIAEGAGKRCHHVFVNSRLGKYMDHMKGRRKYNGRSYLGDLVVSRREEYWSHLLSSDRRPVTDDVDDYRTAATSTDPLEYKG